MGLVLDSSVLIAAIRPVEPGHAVALAFVEALRAAQRAGGGSASAPAELWLEVHVVEQRLANSRRAAVSVGDAMKDLAIELIASGDRAELEAFVALLSRRMRGRRPFANATDLVYLWAAHRTGAAVVTLDRGMLEYHGLVCDVTRPEHARLA